MTDEQIIEAVVSETAAQLYHYPKMLSGDMTELARGIVPLSLAVPLAEIRLLREENAALRLRIGELE